MVKLPIVRTKTAKKCAKMYSTRAGRDKPLFFNDCFLYFLRGAGMAPW